MGNACCGERVREDESESLIQKYDPEANKLSEDQNAAVKKIIEFVENGSMNVNSLDALFKDNTYREAINYREDTAFAPIHYACTDVKVKKLKVLLDNGASVYYVVNNNDWSCLHLVARAPQVGAAGDECMALLLEHGGDSIINYQDAQRKTALHHAVECKKFGMVNLLLTYGANTEVEDNAGKLPLDYITGDDAASTKESIRSVKYEQKRSSISQNRKNEVQPKSNTPESSTNSQPEGAVYASEESKETAVVA